MILHGDPAMQLSRAVCNVILACSCGNLSTKAAKALSSSVSNPTNHTFYSSVQAANEMVGAYMCLSPKKAMLIANFFSSHY